MASAPSDYQCPCGICREKRRAEVAESEVESLRAAIEEYSLWRPGEKGHAAAHRKLMEALR